MHERNILWGELAGGLLIVGCSIALVLSLWRTLEELPYFTFLLFAAITSAVFGAGQYTLHHWKLTATSRGLLVIGLLLTPLNLLLLADPGAKGITDLLDAAVKVAAVIGFSLLVRTGARDLVGTDVLPGPISRRWLLALAVVGAPASQMIPPLFGIEPAIVRTWLPLACYAIACGATIRRLSREQRTATEALGERPAAAVLLFVGLSLFALFTAWGFLLARADDLAATLRNLAVPAAISAVPVLSAGLLVQRRLTEPPGLRATGTAVALTGMVILFASLVLAWPDPRILLLTSAVAAFVLGWVAYRDELPWAYAGAIPCVAIVAVLVAHGIVSGWTIPEGVDAASWLARGMTSAVSGATLVGLGVILAAVSEVFIRRARQADALGYALGAAGVAAAGLMLVTAHGIEEPEIAAWTHLAAAAGFIVASFRWQLRVVAQVGVWLLLLATLWGLWATIPQQPVYWGLVISIEGLVLASVAIALGRAGQPKLFRLQMACRDVAAAAAILGPLIGLGAAQFPRGSIYSATLFAVAATVLILAGLYRLRGLTWIGSLAAVLAFAHLFRFTFDWEPRYAILLAMLIHSTLALVAAFLSRSGTPAPVETTPAEGTAPASEDRSPSPANWIVVYSEPLRLSARLTSCLGVPLLLIPASGLAGAWAGLAAWTGALWLVGAIVWRERGAFPAFQAVITWAAGLAAFAWVERQEWFATSRFGAVDPRALQAYGLAVGLLSVAWLAVRRALSEHELVKKLWAELRPSVDQVVLGALVVGQFLLAAGAILPAVVEELAPLGSPPILASGEAVHVWGPGAWLVLGVLAIALAMSSRWPVDESRRADWPVGGLVLLALTIPCLAAGYYASELAAASALRWGLAAVFLLGSVILVCRENVGIAAARLGFQSVVSPRGLSGIRALLAFAAGVVLTLSFVVATNGLTGRAPSGPAVESIFHRMGWAASMTIPLAALVIGLAATAWRERSAEYASAAGWVWTATVAGGYALVAVLTDGSLSAPESMRVGLLAVGAAAIWALAWLAVEWRVRGMGLLAIHSVAAVVGLAALAAIPLGLLLAFPSRQLGPASARLGQEGWLALAAAVAACYWHSYQFAPRWRIHVVGVAAVLIGVLAACTVQPWDNRGEWLSLHMLAAAWAAAGIGMASSLVAQRDNYVARASRLWPEVVAAGLVLLGLRAGWTDPLRPLAPAGMVIVAGLVFGTVGYRLRSRPHEYLSGLLVALAGVLVWVSQGPDSITSLALSAAIGLAAAGAVWAVVALNPRLNGEPVPVPNEEQPGDDWFGLPFRYDEALPPFPQFAAAVSLALLLFGLYPTLAGASIDPPGLAWVTLAAVAAVLGALLWDPRATYASAGIYVLGIAGVGLALAEVQSGPIWLNRITPVALGAYALVASAIAITLARWPGLFARARLPDRAPGDLRDWFIAAQAIVGAAVLVLAARTAVIEPDLAQRLLGPLAVIVLVVAAGLLAPLGSAVRTFFLRPATLALAVAALGILAWAIPDPSGPVPWLHRHGGVFVALVAAAVCAEFAPRSLNPGWQWSIRKVGGVSAALALVVLVVYLIQQIPHFDPHKDVRRTPLDRLSVLVVIVAILAEIALSLRFALRPDRDPLGPKPGGRQSYVYLAELLLVLLFVQVRLNVPEVFTGKAVRYWTFIVMLLAFIGVGLAELFARRGLHVLSRPLLRTGVLLPLIPLLIFWAKPPQLVFQFADARAPGLRPLLGYLENLPQYFDVYALLWFLAGLLYGLIALSRRSFGWALLGALATNFGIWCLLTYKQVPAAIHPQAWAIPLALIVLVSEHVNRHRLRADAAASLRYLGISMIYISSAADLFIAGIGESVWLPVILAALCLAGVVAGVLLRVRAFLYLGIGFLLLDVVSMIWHAAVDRQQTWVWYASGIVLGALILTLFAVLEKRRNEVQELVGRLREWNR
jgi:hypothetical protein